jgi:2-dehydropantoate 2-reductase
VQAYGTALTGVIDIGRYPSGVDARALALAAALSGARFSSRARPDVMRFKYAKLLTNLGNAAEALCGEGAGARELSERAREEGRAVLEAAGIDFVAPGVGDVQDRWERLGISAIGGRERVGSSTSQSLARGAGSVESDYLNGEIVLLGRLHGFPAPVNQLLQELTRELARDRRAPGSMAAQEVFERLSQRELQLSGVGDSRG